VAEELAAHPIAGVHALACGAAPENCTAAVRQLRPSHLIIVDAADLGEAPGTVCIVAREAIQSTSFGTHGLPLSVVADYLSQEIGCSISVIGIQPTSLAFGETLSPQVSAAVGETLQALRDCLAPPPEGRQRT
jgi:hydrogenase 3 maturation protease